MVGAMFLPCCLTWCQTMVEVIKIMLSSFKRSYAHTAALSAFDSVQATIDPCLHHRPLDTHCQVWFSLLCDHCSFLLGSGMHRVLFVPFKSLFPQSCVRSGGYIVELTVTSSKRAYAIPSSTVPRVLAPAAGHCWPVPPQETLKHSSGSVSVGSLGPSLHKVCLSLQVSLAVMGFDSKWDFTPRTVLLGLLLCPWMWGIFLWWDLTFTCWWLFSSEL